MKVVQTKENMKKQIITVQHTQSVHHTNGMVGSWTDWDLTELGAQQADNIGRNLCNELSEKSVVIYSSDLQRAVQTAQQINKYFHTEILLRSELRERNLGKCVGKSVLWLRENMEVQEKTIYDRMFSDGESRKDVWDRLEPFYQELLNEEHSHIIVVSHGDLLSIFNAMWLKLDVKVLNHSDMWGFAGGVSWFTQKEDGKHLIRKLSDMSYLSDK